jgi:hypothetical protein
VYPSATTPIKYVQPINNKIRIQLTPNKVTTIVNGQIINITNEVLPFTTSQNLKVAIFVASIGGRVESDIFDEQFTISSVKIGQL